MTLQRTFSSHSIGAKELSVSLQQTHPSTWYRHHVPLWYRLTEGDSFTDNRPGFALVLHDDELAQLLLDLDEEED